MSVAKTYPKNPEKKKLEYQQCSMPLNLQRKPFHTDIGLNLFANNSSNMKHAHTLMQNYERFRLH